MAVSSGSHEVFTSYSQTENSGLKLISMVRECYRIALFLRGFENCNYWCE